MNFYKHFIGDFQRDTGHLSLTERGAYLVLMHHYYATEQAIPAEHAALCRIAGAFSKPERDAVKVAAKFFELRDGALWHQRIEAELEKQDGRADTNRRIALEREARKRAENIAREQHEQSTNRAPELAPDAPRNVAREHHDQSTPQSQSQSHKKEDRERGELRASRLPAAWTLPDEWREWGAAERPDVDLDRTADKFRDHWAAKPGKDGRKLDWLATWRNWVRDERAPQAARNGNHSGETAYQRSMRERMQAVCPSIAAKNPNQKPTAEVFDVAPRSLDR